LTERVRAVLGMTQLNQEPFICFFLRFN
jgi:hypothetical protein